MQLVLDESFTALRELYISWTQTKITMKPREIPAVCSELNTTL